VSSYFSLIISLSKFHMRSLYPLLNMPFRFSLSGTSASERAMRIFKKTTHTLCSGEKDSKCPNFLEKKPLETLKRICPICGSKVFRVEMANTVAIASAGVALALITGGSIFIARGSVFVGLLAPTSPKTEVPLASPPSVEQAPSANPANDSIPPVSKPPPLPDITQIQSAIPKLDTMNPNDILEFPVEGDEKYRVIGYQAGDGRYIGWNAKNVKEFLEESLKTNGEFPDGQEIKLIVRNQDNQQRLVLNPISRNSPLGHFVRSLNSSL